MAIAAGGKKIVFRGRTATATDKEGKTQTFVKSSSGGEYSAVASDVPNQSLENATQAVAQATQQLIDKQRAEEEAKKQQSFKSATASVAQATQAVIDRQQQQVQQQLNKNVTENTKQQQINQAYVSNNLNRDNLYGYSGSVRPEQSISANEIYFRDANVSNLPFSGSNEQKELTIAPEKSFGEKVYDTITGKSTANYLTEKQVQAQREQRFAQAGVYGTSAFVVAAPSSVLQVGKEFVQTLTSPLDTIDSAVALTTKEGRSDFGYQAGEFGSRLQKGEPRAASLVAANVLFPQLPKTIKTFKTETELFTAKEIPKDQVFTNNPTTRSTGDALKQFKDANFEIQTSGATPLTTDSFFSKTGTIGEGRKGSKGLEDPGVYFSPGGKGQEQFLRITPMSDAKYTLNPKKLYETYADIFKTPTVTKIQTTGIKVQPKEVTLKPGFEASADYLQTKLGTGEAFITKRSQIGKGEVPKSKFELKQDFPLEQKALTVERNGKIVKLKEGDIAKKGDVVKTAGTSETEAVLPAGTKYKYTDLEGYTIVKGEKVALRRAEIVQDTKVKSGGRTNKNLLDNKKPTTDLNTNLKSLDSDYNPKQLYKSPLEGRVGYGSLAISKLKSQISNIQSNNNINISRRNISNFDNSIPYRNSSPDKNTPISKSPITPSTPSRTPSTPQGDSRVTGSGSSKTGLGGRSSTFGGSSTITAPPSKPPMIRFSNKDVSADKLAYDVYVRQKGKEVKINKQPLGFNEAIKKSKEIDQTVEASTEIRPKGYNNRGDIPAQDYGEKFRLRKTKKALLFVEKSKYRIDSAGEKQGLSLAKQTKGLNKLNMRL